MALFLFFFSLFPALPGTNTGETKLQNDEECPSGIHCKRREQNPPVCPAGFFCPGGNSSAVPVPCPPGTFRPDGAALPSQHCLPCPVDFFNPRPAQKSCFPCGSEAVQPAEGQHGCVCLGKGQVFQPADALCTCPPGFRRSGRDGKVCARQTFPVCRDSASRNQDGQCLSRRGWARYCSHKVCAAPGDFQGYDKVLGLCICHSGSLEGICNSRCRREQKLLLQLSCAQRQARLLITHSDGSKTAVFLGGLRKVLPRPNFSLEDVCGAGQQTHPAHVVEMSEKGFLGVYNPDPQLIHDLVMLDEDPSLHKTSPPPAAAPGHLGPEECGEPREQNLSPKNSTPQPKFLGILNPTTCISGNVTLVFIISREHFPVYDVNNLYNTNAEFDWGDFRNLREEIREDSRNSQKFLLFLFHFQAPGTYVLHLSSNKHKRMYVRVMPAGGRCYQDGPFFPSSPRFVVQVGIGRRKELLLRPDWAAMAGLSSGLLLLLAASLALALLCQGLGWARRGSPSPAFRRRQLQYNLDRFSSKIPEVFAVKKTHPSLQHQAGNSCSAAGTGRFLRRGDSWEAEGQIDLESFNTKVFFELLLRQSQSVTTNLGHFKDEVKAAYHRVMNEISSLKNLWIKALGTPGKEEEDDDDDEDDDNESTGAKEQVPFPGSPLEKPQATRFHSISEISNNPWEFIPQKLIPLLHSVLQVLEENRKNNLSPESPGYSSRSTSKASAAHTEALKTEENQETIPASTTSPALLPSPAQRITHVQQEMQTRFLWEKHSWEWAQLELALLAQEMGTVCSFYQSSREGQEGHRGPESRAGSLDSLLEELSERHRQAGQALLQRHRDEIKHSNLSPELALPKRPQHFLDELPHQLSFCLLSLQSPNHDLSQQQEHARGVEHCPDSVTGMLWVSGMKIVKLEALSQRCLYRVLDLYSHLQAGACPEGVSRILSRFSCQNPGEEVVQEVAESREQQQAARAVEFLRQHHQEGDLLKGLNAEAEAELRKMQAQFRLELQTRTEEKLKAKETEVMQEMEGEKFGNFVAYSLLSQRHLRQRVTLLQDCHRLRNTALKSQKEGTGLEHLGLESLSMDDDSRDILQLLKDNTEYLFLVLEFVQAVRLLQLRETHLKEIITSLKSCGQEKFVDDANVTSNEVKKFRDQKIRELREQLKHLLEKKKTEDISRSFDPFQSLMKDCTESKSSLGKDFQLETQKLRMKLGDKKGEMQQESQAPSHCSQNSQIPGTHPKAEDQLPLFLTKSLKVLKQAEHLMASRIALLSPQHGDGRKCKSSSFLLGLLREVNEELRSLAAAAGLGQRPRLEKTGMTDEGGELRAVDPAALSPREFVVFQYGLSILKFLTFRMKAPELALGVASSLPPSPAPGNAFRNYFFYQNSKKKLFILRDFLGSGGGFLLLLVHCWAHVTAGDLGHDSDPLFLSLFHQALKACLSEMFSLRLQLSAAQGDKSQGINQMLLKEEPISTEEINLISQLLEVRVKNLTDMEAFEKSLLLRVKSEESLNKWPLKKKENFLHPLSSRGRDSLGQRAHLKEETFNSLSPSELEDKVDALTEELVQIFEDEQQFLSSEGNEDLLSYYLEITTLEKESLAKQINALEEEIAQGREL